MAKNGTFRNACKAAFSSASLNGAAAALMSVDMGSLPASAVYLSAVAAGAVNKFRALNNGGDPPETNNPVLRFLTDPSITPRIFMGAAAFNFAMSSYDAFAGPPESQPANLLRMAGWICGFLGDNAVRRLDSANYRKDGTAAVRGSRLRETFNALTANPTLFYNGASIAFMMAVQMAHINGFLSTTKGQIAAAAIGLISIGTAYALKRTRDAAKGKIGTEQINDGVMNYCSSASKGMQSVVTTMTGGHPALAVAQAIFTASNIKVIFETRNALGKKAPGSETPGLPAP